MDERGIIIADKDAEYRSQVADFFRKAGYQVETTESATHALCSILEKQTPVLLLGNDFDKKVSSADLIHLLKKCNRNLAVIMVSDEMPLALARKVRQEGIFYHALRPATAGDTAELGQVVACAFEKQRSEVEAAPSAQEAQLQDELRHVLHDERAQEAAQAAQGAVWSSARLMDALPWLIGMAILIFGTSYLSVLAAEKAEQGSTLAMWLLLAFCALIIASQMLPIFRIKLTLRASHEQQSKENATRKS